MTYKKHVGRSLIMALLLSGSLTMDAQKVTYQFKETSLKAALKEVEKQLQYSIIYKKDVVDEDKLITKNFEDAPIEEVLVSILGEDLTWSIQGKMIVISKKETGQNTKVQQQKQKRISGVIKDATGEPIIGANVVEKGTTNGTVTDMDGKFTLDVQDKGVLQVSYIGYLTQEKIVGNNSILNIEMKEDAQQIDDVVVVGYGVQRKVTSSGSVVGISSEQITKSASQNVSNALAGRTPGVIANTRTGEPGNDNASIMIRGRGTLGNNNPLIVIDGVAGREGYEKLNPNDIESISVLKDASAAIYGAQAANGVILVTTKRGTSGKPTISYDFQHSFSQPTRMVDMVGSPEYAQWMNEVYAYQGNPALYTDAEIELFRNGSDPINYPNTDWYDAVVKNWSNLDKHNLSLRGGNDKAKYFLSAGYLFQDANYKNSGADYKQYNVRANVDANITKDVLITFDISARRSNRQYSGWSASSIWLETKWESPDVVAFYPNGLPGIGVSEGKNPAVMGTDQTGKTNDIQNLINTRFTLRYDIPWIQGLYVDGFAAFDYEFNNFKQWRTPWDVYYYDQQTDEYINFRQSTTFNNISLSQSNTNRSWMTYNARIGYNRRFDEHNFNAFLAYEQSEYKSEVFEASRDNFLSTETPYLFAGDASNQKNDGSASDSGRKNYFGRFGYEYKDRYVAEFNFRYDGSQNFPKGNRYGFFPGIQLAWRMSEEAFIKDNISFIDLLKLRGSWGKMGNDRIDQYQYLTLYGFGDGYNFGPGATKVRGIKQRKVPNEHVRWEVSKNYNLGFDAQFVSGLFGFEFDLFYSKRDNILAQRNASVPKYTGLTLPNENIGKVNNKGFEIMLSHRNKINEVMYSVSGNMSFARNKIKYMDEASNIPDYQKQEGYPMGSTLLYKASGIYHTQAEIDASPHLPNTRPGDLKYEDIDGDGAITANDRIRLYKNNIPEIIFGLAIDLKYRNFDFNVLFQGQGNAVQSVKYTGGNVPMEFYEKRWTEANPNAEFPRANNGSDVGISYASTFYMRDATFVRLKNLEIGYTLPESLLSKINIQNLRIFANGFNLFTLDGVKIQDPEGTSEDGYFYPAQRMLSFGLNLSF
ncbi:TonB-dependent receptor [Parabacteroides sp.]